MSLASVVIPTRNRPRELAALLRSLRCQTVSPEILVMDDGAGGETRELLRSEYPEAAWYRLASARGPAFQRNRGIALATAEIVFPLDDDTELPSPHTLEQTLAEFDDPRVGAVGMPYMDADPGGVVRQHAPGGEGKHLIHAFVGASHAVRRAAFLAVGGYREHYFYMGEEGDLCIRLLQAGYVTIAGRADALRHWESPLRSTIRADYHGRRNDILFLWHNAPLPALALHLPGTTLNGVAWALRERRYRGMLLGAAAGWSGCVTRFREREPVDRDTYALYRRLKHRPLTRLRDVEAALSAIRRRHIRARSPESFGTSSPAPSVEGEHSAHAGVSLGEGPRL